MLAGGLAALAAGRSAWSARLGAGGAVTGGLAGLAAALRVLLGGTPESVRLPWSVPYGSFHLHLDALSAFFLIPLFLLAALAAVYGIGYMRKAAHGRNQGPSWFYYNLLTVSMAVVLVAHNGVLFLTAWETMSLASFFLVTFEHEEPRVRAAGWMYLVATHLGTAFLVAMFLWLGHYAGSLDFDTFASALAAAPPAAAGGLFLLAVIGFGTKAGFMPLHVWLPEAHPAAPSHVSALMSGVMIKTGIYGIVRALTFLGALPAWCGGLLLAIGVVSGVLGVLFALAQHDLKRLLAYHSVENIGIIALGLGVGLLGRAGGLPAVAVLGFAGALFHVLNHALFKGLLFLGAGAVAQAAGTRELDRLGGLLKRMPWTGLTFLIGAAAIAGLPPLNGFASELLVYVGGFRSLLQPVPRLVLAGAAVVGALALIGGLAAACFAKAFGIMFLGEPRHADSAGAMEVGWTQRIPMAMLAGGCILAGLLAPWIIRGLTPVLRQLLPATAPEAISGAVRAASALERIAVTGVGVLLTIVIATLALVRRRLLADRPVTVAGTWDCGYARPSPRMQYTASSFAQPLLDNFHALLRSRRGGTPPAGIFPAPSSFHSSTPDSGQRYLFNPLFARLAGLLGRFRWLQHGRVHLYVLYIAVTLLALLLWKLGGS